MKTASITASPLEELFLDELADIYDAETRLVKALPKMVKAAISEDLQDAFESHLSETEGHVEAVKQVFAAFDRTPKRKKCEAIEGLLAEADEIAADLLQQVLDEEKTANEALTGLARSYCNEQALGNATARNASPTEEGETQEDAPRRSSNRPVAIHRS